MNSWFKSVSWHADVHGGARKTIKQAFTTCGVADSEALIGALFPKPQWRLPSQFGSTFRWLLVFFLMGAYGKGSIQATILDDFTAGGTVKIESFASDGSNVVFRIKARFVFSVSNGWWEVESTYADYFVPNAEIQEQLVGTVLNCRRIPDGNRLFVTSPTPVRQTNISNTRNEVIAAANVTRERFPPFEHGVLFVPWLSLCPNPELPTNSPVLIRWFENSKPPYNIDSFFRFTAEYLQPQHELLSSLAITNGGELFLLDGGKRRLPSPFENGHLGLHFVVLETTNFMGVAFPARAQLRRLAPSHGAITVDDLTPWSVTELHVDWLRVGTCESTNTPRKFVALDARPAGLKQGITVNYLMADDKWPRVDDQKLEAITRVVKDQQATLLPNSGYRGRIVLIVVVLVFALPLAVLVYRKTASNNQKQKGIT